jgi:hypothetical protein
MSMPPEPTRLSLWMDKNGQPVALAVDYRQTGTDTAETFIVLTASNGKKIEVGRHEFEDCNGRYGTQPGHDVYLCISHATCMDWTEGGRKRLEEWKAFRNREQRDLAEFERLKKKFTPQQ